MENETTVKTRSRKAPAKKAEASATEPEAMAAEAAPMVTETAAVELEERKKFTPKDVDPHEYVQVYNGFQGRLVYKSRRTGEKFVWDEFGAVQDMELGELRNARNSNKKYFINNWFMFDEPWIVDYLGMGRYYRHAVSIEGFDTIFDKPAEEVERIVSELSAGQKRSVSYRARQLIAEGNIDSNRVISALERSLGVELVER